MAQRSMAAQVRDGSPTALHQELQTVLAAEAAKDCRFDIDPVSVELGICLLEVANTPPDILPGPIPDNVFVEGLKVPGLVLGVKESRARQKLLLCFGNDGDRNSSLAHLKTVQRTGHPLFSSFSGQCHVPVHSAMRVEGRDTQLSQCYPVAEERGRGLLPYTWKRQNPPAMVTVRVWKVAMDVLDARVARSRDALEHHLKPFCQCAAIVLLTPSKDSSSSIVTVSVADKESAEYLRKQASKLREFGYFEYISCSEAIVEAPILVALREQRRNFDVSLDTMSDSNLMNAKLVPPRERASRVHTSILLRLLHQKQPWHLCFAVKDVRYEEEPERWEHLRQVENSDLRQLVVPFYQKDVSQFVMGMHRQEVEEILIENRCNLQGGNPKLGRPLKGGIKFIVIESTSVTGLRMAKEKIDALAHRISRRLVQRRIPLDMSVFQLLIESKIPYTNPHYYVRMPSHGYLDWIGLCQANVQLRVDGGKTRLLSIHPCQLGNIRKASVDVLVVFSNPSMIPTSGYAALVVQDSRSTLVEEMNVHYESRSGGKRNQPAVLSSGCLNCKAIVCSTLPTSQNEESKFTSALKAILAVCRQMKAKSIAVPHTATPGKTEKWFSTVCREVVLDVAAGGQLERVVLSCPEKSAPVETVTGGLRASLARLQSEPDTGRRILSFNVVQQQSLSLPKPYYLPTTGVITAETSDDLDSAEGKINSFLDGVLEERVVDYPGAPCRRLVERWRELFMDVKVGCRLNYSNIHPQQIKVRGPPSHVNLALQYLEAFIKDSTSDDSSLADTEESGIGMVDMSETAASREAAASNSAMHSETREEDLHVDVDFSTVDVQHECATVRRVRGFVCGEYRTGKSSFIRATLEDEFIEDADSTPGIHVERTMVYFDARSNGIPHFQRFPGVAQLYAEIWAEALQQVPPQHSSEPWGMANSGEERAVHSGSANAYLLPSTPGNQPGEPISELWSMSSMGEAALGLSPANDVEVPIAASDQHSFNNFAVDSLLHEFLPTASRDFAALEFEQQEKMKAEVREQLKKIRDWPEDKPKSRTYFEFWDCAGQMTMTTQQSICLDTARSFFVLVFDASKVLDEEVTVEIYRQDGEDIEIPPLFKGMTHRDFILMWLALIALRQQRDSSASSQGPEATIRKTNVFLVGTHIDKVQDKESVTHEIRKEIEKIASQAGSDSLELKGPYFVDNRRIQDAVVEDTWYNQMVELQKDLAKTIESVEEKEMPLSWMKLEDALHLWQECKQSSEELPVSERALSSISRHHMTFSFFSKLALYISNGCMTSADVEEVLTLFHQLGSVICHDCDHLQDDSLIFLNAEWMLKEFVKLLIYPLQKCRPPDQLSLAADLDSLREKGIVSAPLLKAVWNHLDESVRKSIMATMCHFHLARPLELAAEPGGGAEEACSAGEGQRYFVPFCLTRGESRACLPSTDAEDDDWMIPPLLLKFKTGFFPPPIYSLVALHCSKHFSAEDVSMEYSAMTISVESVHDVRISWSSYGLKFEACSSGEEMEVPTAFAELLGAVVSFLEELKNEHGWAGLNWHLAFVCACSPDSWIELPAKWHSKGAKRKCDSCQSHSKVPAGVKTHWLRNDCDARICSRNGSAHSALSEDYRQMIPAKAPAVGRHDMAADLTSVALNPKASNALGHTEAVADQVPPKQVMVTTSAEGQVVLSGDGAAASTVNVTINNIRDSHVNIGGPAGNSVAERMSGLAQLQGASQASLISPGNYLSLPSSAPLLSDTQITQLWQSTAVQRNVDDIIQSLPTPDGVSHFSRAEFREMKAKAKRRQVLFFTALSQWSHDIGKEHVDHVREHLTQAQLPPEVTEAIQLALE